MESKKKKILYLVTQAEWGGAQKYIFDLAANLAENFDITVATGSSGHSQELLTKLQQNKVKTHIFKHLKRDISPWHDWLAILEINKFLKQNNFDVIHLNSSKAGVLGALAGRINKKSKIIYTAHGWVYLEPLSPLKRWVYLLMEKMACQLRDTTIVLSEKEKNIALKNKTAKKDSVFVIPNGIDLEKTKFLTKEEARDILSNFGISKNDFLIGTIANLYKTKGLNVLINAFKDALTTNPNLTLVIIGDGPERKKIQSRIKNYELEKNVSLVGSIPDACAYLKAFDTFVLSSIKEGFPYTILEAMAAQVPIIATSVGAIPEILDQESAIIIEPNNPPQLTAALEKIINDSTLREKIKRNALEKVKKYDLKNTIHQISALY